VPVTTLVLNWPITGAFDQTNAVFGKISDPLVADTNKSPEACPLHSAESTVIEMFIGIPGFTVSEAVAVHPLSSVTVTVYVPGLRFEMVCVFPLGDQA